MCFRIEGTTSFPSLVCADRFLPHGVVKKPKSLVFSFSQDSFAPKSKKIVKSDSVFTKKDVSPISRAMSDSNSGKYYFKCQSALLCGLAGIQDFLFDMMVSGTFTSERNDDLCWNLEHGTGSMARGHFRVMDNFYYINQYFYLSYRKTWTATRFVVELWSLRQRWGQSGVSSKC